MPNHVRGTEVKWKQCTVKNTNCVTVCTGTSYIFSNILVAGCNPRVFCSYSFTGSTDKYHESSVKVVSDKWISNSLPNSSIIWQASVTIWAGSRRAMHTWDAAHDGYRVDNWTLSSWMTSSGNVSMPAMGFLASADATGQRGGNRIWS